MYINFAGYDLNVATFKADATVHPGDLVEMKDNFTVTRTRPRRELFGICLKVEEGYAAVQMSGYVECPKGNGIPLGVVGLMSGQSGNDVCCCSDYTHYKVIYSDDDVVGFIL